MKLAEVLPGAAPAPTAEESRKAARERKQRNIEALERELRHCLETVRITTVELDRFEAKLAAMAEWERYAHEDQLRALRVKLGSATRREPEIREQIKLAQSAKVNW